ncbi:hypothetical protein [Pseudomonas frederiksbergensis]|uniref:Uncharacterized protein n=1 Tax=Pseudomonas frederiksbergensis TaxID=104087 RepID=A0A6L5BQX7_9PSED|nr:hypothetical protein [Pseudomonas frederiksbergensis]KAF2390778.1 hypothetical protein FX983_05245 [Pseudomonas frederiksbergensis]
MMVSSNFYRWQQDRIKNRLEIIESVLSELDERRTSFELITYLAKHLAEAISSAERKALSDVKNLGVKVSTVKTCRASSLLKSKTYRPRLDMWFLRNAGENIKESAELTELRFKLLKLSNEHAIVKDDLRILQELHGRKVDTYQITTDRNDGMTIAQMVIEHFYEFCEIHEGALVEPSPGRPTIVPSHLFAAYLKWRNSMY